MTSLSESGYLIQSRSWQEGMRYRYSPESYPLTPKQYQELSRLGTLLGQYLNSNVSSNILEFRADTVKDHEGKLWVMEVQTDDRGMPAMALARNAKGPVAPFPGLMESLDQSFREASQKANYTLQFVYPDSERFYYAGLDDVRNILWAINPKAEIGVAPVSQLSISGPEIQRTVPLSGVTTRTTPDLIWDYSETLQLQTVIQPKIDKNLLIDIWSKTDPQSQALRQFIPQVLSPTDPEVIQNKNGWILKPVSGKWSRGLALGLNTDLFLWPSICATPGLLAQRYIQPPYDWFQVSARKNSGYVDQRFFARIEPYYVRLKGQWVLADVLATCTESQPIHGSRDCIMIPATVTKK